ncbi:TraH family protein [Rhizobium hainanense]|uniref:TraH_2 protein n=1 Tax=Rhizobium hainanense TaxID=52131 RepID=A0A1C3WDC0_9HYPH|nr:TraH family protein [Rhizobium hainanense]SCB37846.1 TraH_2 protein [Rhizobium hainanense]
MIDQAMIEKCSDPSLTPAIVEQFVSSAGADDPLTLTIKSDGRLLLIPKPRTPDEGLAALREYVGRAGVRVGITQIPAGIGTTDVSKLDRSLFDACTNLKEGTALFAKVARIVTHWYGSPTNKDILPQMVDDAIYAWKTGYFEGTEVFLAADPGGETFLREGFRPKDLGGDRSSDTEASGRVKQEASQPDANSGSAEMRIDLTRIGGQK